MSNVNVVERMQGVVGVLGRIRTGGSALEIGQILPWKLTFTSARCKSRGDLDEGVVHMYVEAARSRS